MTAIAQDAPRITRDSSQTGRDKTADLSFSYIDSATGILAKKMQNKFLYVRRVNTVAYSMYYSMEYSTVLVYFHHSQFAWIFSHRSQHPYSVRQPVKQLL
jgi:hypothetical protein